MPAEGVSRHHARFFWAGDRFELRDEGSSYGTFVNGERLGPGRTRILSSGDRLSFGKAQYTFRSLIPAARPAEPDFARYAESLRGLASLDPWSVVSRGLQLLREVSGIERALLVNAGRVPRLSSMLTPLDDPELHVSRSAIEAALRDGQAVSRFLPESAIAPTESMAELNLRRIWVHPIADPEGQPIAAIYLDSPISAPPPTAEAEALLTAVAGHIGTALRNALLHARYVDLVDELENRVQQRTRELEASQAQLIAQDRLAVLGRLVAAIAHELNNPVGAIASFAGTLRRLVEPIMRAQSDLEAMFPDSAQCRQAGRLLDLASGAAQHVLLDSRARRELEANLAERLIAGGIPAGPALAARFARIGLTPVEVEPFQSILRTQGERLTAMAEQVFTFGRSLETIGRSAANVARIVDGLKTYSHLDHSQVEVADIHRSIEATLTVLSPRLPKGIEVITRFSDIPPFGHRPGELTQVWTNLVDNAARAMGERGTLSVETHDEGDHARITVADTGPGVPEAIRDRIFELHVTSRGPGAGLGLGLPICRTIVEKNHGGAISFESRPGHTTFTVVLPKHGPLSQES